MTRRILILILFLIPSLARAQSQQITVGPFSKAGLVYVCPVPSGGTPCPSPSSIFSDSGLTQALANPFSIPTQAIVTFYAAGGQYTIEMPASGTQQVVGGGGSSVVGVPGPVFNVKDPKYGAVGDAKKSATVTTASTAVLTDSTASPWLSSDIGKKIYCVNTTGGLSTLTTTISTITAFTSSSSITVSSNGLGASTSNCVWFTQKETTAFLAAGTAAKAALQSATLGGTVLAVPGAVYCPPGGYVVDTAFFFQNFASITNGVSFLGSGVNSCKIFTSPDITKTSGVSMIYSSQASNLTIGGFEVDCSGFANSLGATAMFIDHQFHYIVKDIQLDSCGDSGGLSSIFNFSNTANGYIDGITINSSSPGSTAPAIQFVNGNSGIYARNIYTTNPGPIPLSLSNGGVTPGGPRNTFGGGITIVNSVFDEGGSPGAITVAGTAGVNFIGVTAFAGTGTILTVDANSSVYLTDSTLAPFSSSCGGANRNAITIASGGVVEATLTSIQGCGTSSAVTGPAGATFVDVGGNDIRNCTGTYPCALVTAATYSTLGFSGGIIPKATVTHTPNTCYAVTGNLLATAQNICTLLLDQNYQVVNITAQSGGTTPANSSCTGAPVITLSDGTRTGTLTMTTGKTQWSSAVDVSTVNSVFASGTTLTVSIGANTCATPPSNVSVNYVLQSVLNP